MSLQQRLAKLEQAQTGDEGTGVLGVRRIHYLTKTGPDVVTIPQTGETLTEAEFRERYPRGLLILRMQYTDVAPAGRDVGNAVSVDGRGFQQDTEARGERRYR